MASLCTPPTCTDVLLQMLPVLLPVVRTESRSARIDGGSGPRRFAQFAMLAIFGFAVVGLAVAGCEPVVGLLGTVVLLEVPDGGAITPRAKISYRLIACTS